MDFLSSLPWDHIGPTIGAFLGAFVANRVRLRKVIASIAVKVADVTIAAHERSCLWRPGRITHPTLTPSPKIGG